jgi:hypothetical protein
VGELIGRRELLALAGGAMGAVGLTAMLPLALQGCSVPDEEQLNRRLIESLRALVGDRPGAGYVSRSVDMTQQEALRKLRADLSERRLVAATSNRFLLRRFVDGRREADFSDGRARYVEGWLLSDTEIAIAVLLGF